VRDVCCAGVDFGPTLLKKHWGGYIANVSATDRYPPRLGVRASVGAQSVERMAAALSVCGQPAHTTSLLPAEACSPVTPERRRWFKVWEAEREARKRANAAKRKGAAG